MERATVTTGNRISRLAAPSSRCTHARAEGGFTLMGAPEGATIDPVSGAFSWTPAAAGDVTFQIVATDDGTPELSDMEEVTISVT